MGAPAVSEVDRANVQGLVRFGYGNLHEARFLRFQIVDDSAARAWLGELELTSASRFPADSAVNLALTHRGMKRLGLAQSVLDEFPEELARGMITPHRQRILGDHGDSAPSEWDWGGPESPVDGVLLLYAAPGGMDTLAERVFERVRGVDLNDLDRPSWLPQEKEHFGFHDGVGQPNILGVNSAGPGPNSIAAGEIVLGYPNQYGKYPHSPRLPGASQILGGDDLGKDGSYLVMRQLEQRVADFWAFVREAATTARIGDRYPHAGDPAVVLAAKMVGRWPSGAPLVSAPDGDDPALAKENDFLYRRDGDADGIACPFGAHIRRTNPRDWQLAPEPDDALVVANRHRILRRGRAYGPPLVPTMETAALSRAPDDEKDRGLHFVCLNANIGRQFEFVQQTWVNNPVFAGLYGGADPLLGDQTPATTARGHDATFVVPAKPCRIRITGMQRFIRVRGGAYFFLPSLAAVRYLASL